MQVQEALLPCEEVRTLSKSIGPGLLPRAFISWPHLYAAALCSLQPKPIRHRAVG